MHWKLLEGGYYDSEVILLFRRIQTRVKDQILEQKNAPSSYHLGNFKSFGVSVPGTGGRDQDMH